MSLAKVSLNAELLPRHLLRRRSGLRGAQQRKEQLVGARVVRERLLQDRDLLLGRCCCHAWPQPPARRPAPHPCFTSRARQIHGLMRGYPPSGTAAFLMRQLMKVRARDSMNDTYKAQLLILKGQADVPFALICWTCMPGNLLV